MEPGENRNRLLLTGNKKGRVAFPLLVNTSFLKKSHCWLCHYRTFILMHSSWNGARDIRNHLVFVASARPKHNAEVCNFILIFFWSNHIFSLFRFSQVSTQRWKSFVRIFMFYLGNHKPPRPAVMVFKPDLKFSRLPSSVGSATKTDVAFPWILHF